MATIASAPTYTCICVCKDKIHTNLVCLIGKQNIVYAESAKIYQILNRLINIYENKFIRYKSIKDANDMVDYLYEYRNKYEMLEYKKRVIDTILDNFIEKHKGILCCSNPQHCGHINWPWGPPKGYVAPKSGLKISIPKDITPEPTPESSPYIMPKFEYMAARSTIIAKTLTYIR